jgi:hypothetical protein
VNGRNYELRVVNCEQLGQAGQPDDLGWLRRDGGFVNGRNYELRVVNREQLGQAGHTDDLCWLPSIRKSEFEISGSL